MRTAGCAIAREKIVSPCSPIAVTRIVPLSAGVDPGVATMIRDPSVDTVHIIRAANGIATTRSQFLPCSTTSVRYGGSIVTLRWIEPLHEARRRCVAERS